MSTQNNPGAAGLALVQALLTRFENGRDPAKMAQYLEAVPKRDRPTLEAWWPNRQEKQHLEKIRGHVQRLSSTTPEAEKRGIRRALQQCLRNRQGPQWQSLAGALAADLGIELTAAPGQANAPKTVRPGKRTAPAGDLWIAVGDETGKWDLKGSAGFLGLSVVLGRFSDWWRTREEPDPFTGRPLGKCLAEPLQQLPQGASNSRHHHVLDALDTKNVSKARLPGGQLSEPGGSRLQQELFGRLRWLAEHPRLATLGIYGRGWDFFPEDTADVAHVLGWSYGVLTLAIAPFLKPEDRLYVVLAERSEQGNLLERQRTEPKSAEPSSGEEPRKQAPLRVSHIGWRDVLERSFNELESLGGTALDQIEAGRLDYLRQWAKHQSLEGSTRLPDYRTWLNPVADLGAALMALAHNEREQRQIAEEPSWRNVWFQPVQGGQGS